MKNKNVKVSDLNLKSSLNTDVISELEERFDFNASEKIKNLVKDFSNEKKKQKKFVDTQIRKTSNYLQFKKFSSNREININDICKILKSMDNCGDTGEIVLVNKNYEIVSGQHLFLTRMLLGLEIVYAIVEDFSVEELRTRETGTNWNDLSSIKSLCTDVTNPGVIQKYRLFVEMGKSLKPLMKNKTHKKISFPQFVAITEEKPEFLGGLAGKSNPSVYKNLNNKILSKTDIDFVKKVVYIYSLAQVVLIKFRAKKINASKALLSLIFKNKEIIDFNHLEYVISRNPYADAGSVSEYYNDIKVQYNTRLKNNKKALV